MNKLLWIPWIFSFAFFQGIVNPSEDSNTPIPLERNEVPKQKYPTAEITNTQAPWVKNTGQWEEDILFVAHTFTGNTIINKKKEILYALPIDSTSGYVLKERFVGKLVTYEKHLPKGEKKTSSIFNYFKGSDPSQWKTKVPSYQVLNLGEIWEGVELTLNAHNDNVEKLFHLKPNAKPQSIEIVIDGAESLAISSEGQLMAQTPVGEISYSTPIAYQWINGEKHLAKAEYKVKEKNSYTFTVDDYDPKYELIIDPLLASTFIGDGGNDWGNAIAVDEDGNVFTTGYAWSDNFPTTAGSFSESFNGVKDAFVSKLSNDLSTLLVSSYLG